MQCLIVKAISPALCSPNGGAVMEEEALMPGDLIPEGGWGAGGPVVMLTVCGELPSSPAGVRRVTLLLIPLNLKRQSLFLADWRI